VLGNPALATADAAALERRLRPLFELLVHPPADAEPS
jgi:hypothetical protein